MVPIRRLYRAALIIGVIAFSLYVNPLATLFAQETPGDIRRLDTPGIVGGHTVNRGAYPWQVMLLNHWGNFYCGGTLIAVDWVLTAGHCTYDVTVSQVVLGAHSRMDSGESSRQTIAVDRVIRHPQYDDRSLNHDIALLHLSRPAVLTRWVAPLAFVIAPADDALWSPATAAVITGWGATEEDGMFATDLQEVSVPIVEQAHCEDAYPGAITDSMFCAGYPAGGKDACQGDSGGPLIVANGQGGWKLAGIISWGSGCAQPDSYGIYTKVANYHEWIVTQTGPFPTSTVTPTPTPPTGQTGSPTPTATPTPQELGIVQNGSFEAGSDGAWRERSIRHSTLIQSDLPISPHAGHYAALLGNADQETSRIYQRVKLPAAAHLYLVFHYQVLSTEGTCGRDKARLYLNSQRAFEWSLCRTNTTTSWEEAVVDITRYANTRQQLQFFAKTSRRDPSSWLIDDVYLTTALDEQRAGHVLEAAGIEDREAEEDIELLYLPLILQK
ncbi:MAG: serine protease [Caldilineaceae bacterium]|nr:serine protease [Caldilineaceae bacterium]